jgi:hypothetical protein
LSVTCADPSILKDEIVNTSDEKSAFRQRFQTHLDVIIAADSYMLDQVADHAAQQAIFVLHRWVDSESLDTESIPPNELPTYLQCDHTTKFTDISCTAIDAKCLHKLTPVMEIIRQLYKSTPEDEDMLSQMMAIRNALLIILKGEVRKGDIYVEKWRTASDSKLLRQVMEEIPRFTYDWFHTKLAGYSRICISCKMRWFLMHADLFQECQDRYCEDYETRRAVAVAEECHNHMTAPYVIHECCEHGTVAYDSCDARCLFDHCDPEAPDEVRNAPCSHHAQLRRQEGFNYHSAGGICRDAACSEIIEAQSQAANPCYRCGELGSLDLYPH